MRRIKIDCCKIRDWNSFHRVFEESFNFPSYYGRNMDAWIDCMDDFSQETTLIDLENSKQLGKELKNAILDSSAFVNFRKLEAGEQATLLVACA